MHKSSDKKLVISLKSSSIELSVVDLKEGPKVLFTQKDSLLFKDPLKAKDFISTSLNSLKKIIKNNIFDITRELKGSSECEIILYSPWYLPELISEKNKSKKIGLKKFFMDKVKPPQQKDYQQIENKITNILLNGYKLSKLKDIESDDIEINIYRSFASKNTIEDIEKAVKSELRQISIIEFSTSSMLIYESLKQLFINADDFVFINIGGEITEVGVVEDDILTFESSVPIGSHMFSRELDTFITQKGNLSTLKFLSNKSTDEKLDKIKEAKIEKLKNIWANEIFDSLSETGKELPSKFFIISNSESLDFFKMIISDTKEFKNHDCFSINNGVFEDKVENLEKKPNKNVEYLLSAYYLSIKS